MQYDNNTPIIAESINIQVPSKWETPQLFKTDFENTEGGPQPFNYEATAGTISGFPPL